MRKGRVITEEWGRQASRRRRRQSGGLFLGVLFFLLVAVGTAFILIHRALSTEKLSGMAQVQGTVNILLLGSDLNYGEGGARTTANGRTDTLILACLNADRREAALFSIPRDSVVWIPGKGEGLINSAAAYGGPELAVRTVENLLDISIPYYAHVDFNGFKEIIDLLGGVEVNVDKDMYYYDRAGNFQVNLKKGRQVLDGEKALQFVRYRRDKLGDIARIRRQQELMQAIINKAQNWRSATRWPALFRTLRQHLDTNMSQTQLLRVANFLRVNGLARVELATFPGNFAGSHWRVDVPAAQAMLQEFLYRLPAEEGTTP